MGVHGQTYRSGLLRGCAWPDLPRVMGASGIPRRSLCLPEYLAYASNSTSRDSFGYFKVIPLVKMQILLGQEKNNTFGSIRLLHFSMKEFI